MTNSGDFQKRRNLSENHLEQLKELIDEFELSLLASLSFKRRGKFSIQLKRHVIEKKKSNFQMAEESYNQQKKKALNNNVSNEKAVNQEILAPMSGIYYEGASPNEQPFVQKGQILKKGVTLCIIETMKVMNQFLLENDGQLVKILKKNLDFVKEGELLFLIRTQ